MRPVLLEVHLEDNYIKTEKNDMGDILIFLAFSIGFILIFLFAVWLDAKTDSSCREDEWDN